MLSKASRNHLVILRQGCFTKYGFFESITLFSFLLLTKNYSKSILGLLLSIGKASRIHLVILRQGRFILQVFRKQMNDSFFWFLLPTKHGPKEILGFLLSIGKASQPPIVILRQGCLTTTGFSQADDLTIFNRVTHKQMIAV